MKMLTIQKTVCCVVSFVILSMLMYKIYTMFMVKKEGFEEDKLYFFHAKWCGHCTKFLPDVESFSKRELITVDIVEDSDITDELRTEFDVNAYPMLYYKNTSKNIKELYEGERSSKGIEEFVEKMRNQI